MINGNLAYDSGSNNSFLIASQDSTNAEFDLTINAAISKVGGADLGTFYFTGNGTTLLTGASTFKPANLQLRSGTVVLGADDTLNSNGPLGNNGVRLDIGGFSEGTNPATLLLRSGVATDRNIRTVNADGGGSSASTRTVGGYDTTGTATFNGLLQLFNTTSGDNTVRLQALGTSTAVFNGNIERNPSATQETGITKVGTGTVVLAGLNNYGGATTISNGTLRVSTLANAGSASSIGTNGSITLAGSSAANAVLDYTGTDTTINRSLILNNGGGTVNMASPSTTVTMTGSASGSGQLVLSEGRMILSNTGTSNSFAPASIQVDSGATLQLGASNQIGDSTGLILNGGTFIVGTATAGYSETLGTLTLNANSTIDLGSFSTGLRTLSFANSSAITWTGTLTITNWQGMTRAPSDVAQILFGTGGLTTTQLGQIYFANQDINGGVLVGGSGELVPIPEAEVYWGALAIALAVGYRERRRLIAILQKIRR